jgi:hypothetical protein
MNSEKYYNIFLLFPYFTINIYKNNLNFIENLILEIEKSWRKPRNVYKS